MSFVLPMEYTVSGHSFERIINVLSSMFSLMIFSKLCHVARCRGCSVCECLLFCQWSSIVVLAVVLSCGLVAINSGIKIVVVEVVVF